MKELLKSINFLMNSDVRKQVDARIKEFKEVNKNSGDELFKEMCFCILTANFNAEKCIKIQDEIKDGFFLLSKKKLAKKLTEVGHRFPNARAGYISESVKYKNDLKEIIQTYNGEELRGWFVKNIKGLGYKETSHFLRNIGFNDFAVIDFHIVDILVRYNLIKKSKVLTKKKYLEVESMLKEIGRNLNLNLAELDLYLWYLETGKILK